jgi:iron complex outermembrane receptor protein
MSLSTRLLAGTAITLFLGGLAGLPAYADDAAHPDTATPAAATDTASNPANGDATDADAASAVGEVVVTARGRRENVQDVPIPVSVLSGADLERDNDVTITDITRKAPNISVNAPNARQTSIAIRGVGKNSANDSMEASVGVIVDNVVADHVGMSWGDFVDIQSIEVARGPQGTLLGKNTTLGAINITTKGPTFTPEGVLEATIGDPGVYEARGSYSAPLIGDKLAFRASFYTDNRDGQLHNLYNSNETWLETRRWGGRLQFLAKPSDNITARIILDHSQSSERINIDPLILDPATFDDGSTRPTTFSSRMARSYFGGYKPIIGSVDFIDTNEGQPLQTKQNGISAEVNWNQPSGFTLTSITAYRALDFDAKNDGDETRFSISRNGTLLSDDQFSQEFRLASPSGHAIDYQVGAFYLGSRIQSTSRTLYGVDSGAFYATNAQYTSLGNSPVGRALLQDSLKGVFLTTETRPTTDSYAVFGQANWNITDRFKLTLGVRDSYEDKDNSIAKVTAVSGVVLDPANYAGATATQLSNAQAIRDGQVGSVFFAPGVPISQNSVSWLVSPNFKLTDNILLYASASHGEKSGAVQFNNSTGAPLNVNPEKTDDYEVGAKGIYFDHHLILNLNLYQTEIDGYQANLTVLDPTQASGTRSFLGNAGDIRLRGVEAEGTWYPIDRLSFNYSAAYNDAIYTDYSNATCPADLANVPQVDRKGAPLALGICDFTGRQLPNAPRYVGNVGVDWRPKLTEKLDGHFYLNASYRAKANVNPSLSAFGIQPAYTIVDGGVGIATRDDKYEVVLWVKNLADTKFVTNINAYSSSAAVSETLGERRSFGVTLRTKL